MVGFVHVENIPKIGLIKMEKLLTRDNFREGVFERDNHKCVICGEPGKDAHHILERRLWNDGGYYLNNGATLCEKHHIEAETTILDCNTIREKCKIDKILLPEQLYDEYEYDKWGNIIQPTGQRLKGELFYDESVQKILEKGDVLKSFSKYVKYPRTYHLPWSHLLKDDRQLENDEQFIGKRVIVSLKKDGENSTMYNDYFHARSLNSGSHPTRNWVKVLWAQIYYLIDDYMRICGENLYAVHSIQYDNLESYFYMFSIWIENKCLSWDETKDYATILGLHTVEVIYDDIYDKNKIHNLFLKEHSNEEGYVIRLADEFTYSNFRKSVAKFVKPEFRQVINNSHGHWISKKIEVNKLNEKSN